MFAPVVSETRPRRDQLFWDARLLREGSSSSRRLTGPCVSPMSSLSASFLSGPSFLRLGTGLRFAWRRRLRHTKYCKLLCESVAEGYARRIRAPSQRPGFPGPISTPGSMPRITRRPTITRPCLPLFFKRPSAPRTSRLSCLTKSARHRRPARAPDPRRWTASPAPPSTGERKGW